MINWSLISLVKPIIDSEINDLGETNTDSHHVHFSHITNDFW